MPGYDLSRYLLRKGRKVGRTLYLTPITHPDADGILIGLVDDVQIADELVRLWNEQRAPGEQ
jgi:hypothetical protein